MSLLAFVVPSFSSLAFPTSLLPFFSSPLPHHSPGLCSLIFPAATAANPACRGSSSSSSSRRRRRRRRRRRSSSRWRGGGNVSPAQPLPSSPTSRCSPLTLSCNIRRSVICASTIHIVVQYKMYCCVSFNTPELALPQQHTMYDGKLTQKRHRAQNAYFYRP